MPSNHPDEAQDEVQIDSNLDQLVQELSPILIMLSQRVDELQKKVDEQQDFLMNKFIGGLKGAYRGSEVSRLKGAYGDKFADLLDYKNKVHGADPEEFYGSMFDQLQDGGDETELVQQLLDRLTGERDAHKALFMGKPDATMEVKAEGEPEAVQEAAEKVPEVVEQAVEEEPAVGSPEYFKKHGRKAKASKAD